MLSQYANRCVSQYKNRYAFAVCKSLCFAVRNPLYSNYRNSIYRAKIRNFFLTTKSRRIFLEKGDIIWLNVLSNSKCNFPAK